MSSASSTTTSSSPWPLEAILAAGILCLGTATSQIFFQHVSNAAPKYFYSLAVVSPLSGLICYSIIIRVGTVWFSNNNNKAPRTLEVYQSAMPYCIRIGACFAVTNILTDFGKSGGAAGVPDVSTVLSLVLQKLVVPVSLVLESALERHRPTTWEISGVLAVMLGIVSTVQVYHRDTDAERSSLYGMKVFCLLMSSLPLALGFYLVGVARRKLPEVSGIELWAVLCVPEFFFSIFLAFLTQFMKHRHSFVEICTNIWNGMACILVGSQPDGEMDVNCKEAARFFWFGIPFGFALNLAIPVLVNLKGSTSVPLFRALALPIAALVTMTNIVDKSIRSSFSWDAIFGVIACTAGLFLYYGEDVKHFALGFSTVKSIDGLNV